MHIQKILIQRADKLGDVIFTLPMIQALKDQMPEAEIYYLTSALGAQFLECHPLVEKCIVSDLEKDRILNESLLIKVLKEEHFDCYISCWNHPAYAKLGKKLDIPLRIGDSTNFLLKRFYTHPVKQSWSDFTKHQVEFNFELLQPLQIFHVPDQVSVPLSNDAEAQAYQWFKKWFEPHKKVVTIFTATGGTNIPLDPDIILTFIDSLLETELYHVVLCGPDDPDEPLISYQQEGVLNLIGKTSMSELIAVIRKSDFYIGSDTGPTHIASSLNIPLLFYSPLRDLPPLRWGPRCHHFSILRKEYLNKNPLGFESPVWMTASYLQEAFYKLVDSVCQNERYSSSEQKREHLLQTCRVLYLNTDVTAYNKAMAVAPAFRREGLRLFTHKVDGSWLTIFPVILNWVNQYNINIIQGDVPVWVRWALKLYKGVIKKTFPPIYSPLPFQKYVGLKDHIQRYRDEWAKV